MRSPGTAHRSCIVSTELKEASDLVAQELGIGISEYLRLALIHLVNEREIPFKQQRSYMRSGRRPRQAQEAQ